MKRFIVVLLLLAGLAGAAIADHVAWHLFYPEGSQESVQGVINKLRHECLDESCNSHEVQEAVESLRALGAFGTVVVNGTRYTV